MTTCFGPAPCSQKYLAIQEYDFHINHCELLFLAYFYVKKRLLFVEKLQLEILFFNSKSSNCHISVNIWPIWVLLAAKWVLFRVWHVSHVSRHSNGTGEVLKSLGNLFIFYFFTKNARNDYMFWTCTLFPKILSYTKPWFSYQSSWTTISSIFL